MITSPYGALVLLVGQPRKNFFSDPSPHPCFRTFVIVLSMMGCDNRVSAALPQNGTGIRIYQLW